MPIYNAEATLKECLDSILRQTYSNFEVVAVDDGSGDAGPAVLKDFARRDPRIRISTLPENRGIVEALNLGLDECRGEWIARMDADDRMLPDRLRLQRNYFDEHP
ncbi:MAG: glycosyltransferase family 2 protein, partial [Proteobacteria bacterium]|nr:glycosyltransferase family 2 protein [Pseudomonadota bacterium]